MTTPDEIAVIARRLSKAQKRLLLTAHNTFIMDRMKCRGKSKPLRERGILTLAWRGSDLLTPLGIAVRTYLETHP